MYVKFNPIAIIQTKKKSLEFLGLSIRGGADQTQPHRGADVLRVTLDTGAAAPEESVCEALALKEVIILWNPGSYLELCRLGEERGLPLP